MGVISFSQAVAIVAGSCSGASLGAFLTTRTEMLRRGVIPRPIDPFERIAPIIAIKMVIFASFHLLTVAAIMLVLGLGILRLAGLHGLDGTTKLPFGLAFVTGAALAKFVRYFYWRSSA